MRAGFALAILCVLLEACAPLRPMVDDDQSIPSQSTATAEPAAEVPRFSAGTTSQSVPPGWREWRLHPTKRLTRYRLEREDGLVVVRADADRSASGLVAPIRFDASRTPVIRWRWKIDELVEDADNSAAATEDAPCRVVLAFDGDKSRLPLREQLFFERVQLLSGHEMPYATLMYIWGNREPVESVIVNPHTHRVRKLVATTGTEKSRQWVQIQRNYVEDFKRVYGEEPGRLLAVSIMTDTDNTGDTVTAWYGDIELLRSDVTRP
jgi:hypothetical protein